MALVPKTDTLSLLIYLTKLGDADYETENIINFGFRMDLLTLEE